MLCLPAAQMEVLTGVHQLELMMMSVTSAYQWFGTMSVAPTGRIDVDMAGYP